MQLLPETFSGRNMQQSAPSSPDHLTLPCLSKKNPDRSPQDIGVMPLGRNFDQAVAHDRTSFQNNSRKVTSSIISHFVFNSSIRFVPILKWCRKQAQLFFLSTMTTELPLQWNSELDLLLGIWPPLCCPSETILGFFGTRSHSTNFLR